MNNGPENEGNQGNDVNLPEQRIESSPEISGDNFLDHQIAEEGNSLREKGTFFQDLPKWAKVLSEKTLALLQFASIGAGLIMAGQAKFFSENPEEIKMYILGAVVAALVAGASAGLREVVKASIKKGDRNG